MSLDALDLSVLDSLVRALAVGLAVAAALTTVVLAKSMLDFTRTGPQMTEEILSHYRLYLVFALGRLAFWLFTIIGFLATPGALAYVVGLALFERPYQPAGAALAAVAAVAVLVARAFVRTLLLSPGVLASSSLYSMTHFYPLWAWLTPRRLLILDVVLFGALSAWLAAGVLVLAHIGAWVAAGMVTALALAIAAVRWVATRDPEPAPALTMKRHAQPNILLIGADTLRADRLTGAGYPRDLTPIIDKLAARGVRFTDCYVPCARTAPSLVSLLTGTWPHTHGVRDTFVSPEQTRLPTTALPEMLGRAGYSTAIVGDWAASDAEKFTFGFEYEDLPKDQWNIKYLLRQGPKDLRLCLSLFTQNRFGKAVLPEVHFLGGHPLTEEVGRDTRRMISRLAAKDAPFFLVSFMATTHPPFTSKYPYYSLYADPHYNGESRFGMAKLRDPWEIIRRQGEPRAEFDLDQIIDLYDGCVKNFDDEVGRILAYLDRSNLAQDTIVVVFSDHGFEFFEHDTWGQGNSAVGDFSARIPLVIADPRMRQSQTVSDAVRTVDVAPTLLELVGMPVPAYMEGVSLASSMRHGALHQLLPAFYETGVWLTDLPGTPETHLRYPSLPELLEVPDKQLGMICIKPKYLDAIIGAKDRMIRLGDWKLSYQPLADGPLYKLFNVRDDAACLHDVLARYPDVAARLRALLDRWMAADTSALRASPASGRDPSASGRMPSAEVKGATT